MIKLNRLIGGETGFTQACTVARRGERKQAAGHACVSARCRQGTSHSVWWVCCSSLPWLVAVALAVGPYAGR